MSARASSADAAGHLLLAAEDKEAHRFVLRQIMQQVSRLDQVPVRLRFAGNGVELLDYLRAPPGDADRPRPRLVLLDLHMPGMGGLEALRLMRADETLRRIPVVIMSSSDKSSHVDEAYQLGANAFLVKKGGHASLLEQMRAFAAFWLNVAKLPEGGP